MIPSFAMTVVADLKKIIEMRLNVSLADMSIVWCLVGSGQLAVLNDIQSLRAVILDHQTAGKHAIQLYVVKKFGKLKTKAEHDGVDS